MGKKKQIKECKPIPSAKVGGRVESESTQSEAGSSVQPAKGSVGRSVAVTSKQTVPAGMSQDFTGLGKMGRKDPRETYSKKPGARS